MRKAFLALSIVLIASACGEKKVSQEKPALYKTIVVTPGSQVIETRYAASLEGSQVVEIRPQVSGTITEICFEEGDVVRKGQTLFILDQVPYQAALAVAEANLKSAEAQLDNAKLTEESNQMLYDRGVISIYELRTAQNSLAAAEAAYMQAQAQLLTANNDLSYTVVKSPADGVTGMISYRVGALVSSSITTPMVTVSSDDDVFAYFSLNENQILDLTRQYRTQERLMAEMPEVSLVMSNGERYNIKGRIDAASGIVDSGTGAVRMRARFANPQHLLKSGGSATVIIPTELENRIVIPQTATYEIQEKTFAYKVVDGRAVSVELEVFRLNNGIEFVVESGLEEGDVIVAEGAGLLREGTLIQTYKSE